jgi:HSP20 family molecular chaperone IbpA
MEVLIMRKDLTNPRRVQFGTSVFDDFDRIFGNMFANMTPAKQQDNYPVCNVFVDKDDVLHFEFALAGFTKEELAVEIDGTILTVQAEKSTEEADENKYVIRRFAKRQIQSPLILLMAY